MALTNHLPQTPAAESFSGWSVSLRLRLLALALLTTLLCGVVLLWLDVQSASAEGAVYQQLLGTLSIAHPAQQSALQLEHLKAAQTAHAAAQSQIVWLQAAMALLSTIAALIMGLGFFRPLQRLYTALRAIANGQTLASSPVRGRNEFAQLGAALFTLSQLSQRLNTLAYQDELTGLPNQVQFKRDLEQLLNTAQPCAVLFADIDHFRTINDGYGYRFGDQVLKALSLQLAARSTVGHCLYRYSGDRFAVCITAPMPFDAARFKATVAAAAEQLRATLAAPLQIENHSLSLCISLGVAHFPDDADSVDSLISAADSAMYQAKHLGRNVVQFAHADFSLRARQRIELANDLRAALQSGAITPHFQPIVDLRSGTLVCAEALARWKHPVRGFVPPDVFIGIAEASGQIDRLTEQLLRTACREAVQWRGSQGQPPPRLAFNLSPRQVREDVVEMIGRVLTETGLPASQLEIEIIESAIIERPETAERLLRQLKTLGVSIALDDFGTGYSSLSYLLRFPIDKIKVDRSFVAQLNDQKQAGKIVAATISLAASLEIGLVAEGVEHIGQMLTLYELGCHQQQGWLFGKALPAAEFSRWALDAPLRLDAVVRAQSEPQLEQQTAA